MKEDDSLGRPLKGAAERRRQKKTVEGELLKRNVAVYNMLYCLGIIVLYQFVPQGDATSHYNFYLSRYRTIIKR